MTTTREQVRDRVLVEINGADGTPSSIEALVGVLDSFIGANDWLRELQEQALTTRPAYGFEGVSDALGLVDVEQLPTLVMIAVLSATQCCKTKIPSRVDFKVRCRSAVASRDSDEFREALEGLK